MHDVSMKNQLLIVEYKIIVNYCLTSFLVSHPSSHKSGHILIEIIGSPYILCHWIR
jgi:hypothetical protein